MWTDAGECVLKPLHHGCPDSLRFSSRRWTCMQPGWPRRPEDMAQAAALGRGPGLGALLAEGFVALDHGTLHQAMQCALERAPTLLVIAHP